MNGVNVQVMFIFMEYRRNQFNQVIFVGSRILLRFAVDRTMFFTAIKTTRIKCIIR